MKILLDLEFNQTTGETRIVVEVMYFFNDRAE